MNKTDGGLRNIAKHEREKYYVSFKFDFIFPFSFYFPCYCFYTNILR
jgi:hypothetical protein